MMEEKILICKYRKICDSIGFKCKTCKHNVNKKKDYYEPDRPQWTWPTYLHTPNPTWKRRNDIEYFCSGW